MHFTGRISTSGVVCIADILETLHMIKWFATRSEGKEPTQTQDPFTPLHLGNS